jgi:two-component system C4-dicarboxylate transport sensor histidine kinase DctB
MGASRALAELHGVAAASLGLHAAALRSDLEKHRAVAFVLARDNDVAMLSGHPSDPGMVDRANRKLEALGEGTRAAAIYVVDQAGLAVAASNWRLTTSFVGQDYGFRVYVRAALAEGAGEQFSSGTVSQRAGYYLARRVETGSAPAGAVVVKVEFDELEKEWQRTGGHVLVTDADGVVLLTDEPEWRFSTLRALPEATRDRLRDEAQYGAGVPLTPLPVVRRQEVDPAGSVVRLQGPGMAETEASFLELSAPVPGTGWRLHRLEPLQPTVGRARNSAMMAALLAAAAAASTVLLLLHRRRRARRLLEEKERVRVELERRVAERTAELSRSNALLRGEVEERLRAEADLRRAQDDLVQAAKLAALGQTAASIAHEVNQPWRPCAPTPTMRPSCWRAGGRRTPRPTWPPSPPSPSASRRSRRT